MESRNHLTRQSLEAFSTQIEKHLNLLADEVKNEHLTNDRISELFQSLFSEREIPLVNNDHIKNECQKLVEIKESFCKTHDADSQYILSNIIFRNFVESTCNSITGAEEFFPWDVDDDDYHRDRLEEIKDIYAE